MSFEFIHKQDLKQCCKNWTLNITKDLCIGGIRCMLTKTSKTLKLQISIQHA